MQLTRKSVSGWTAVEALVATVLIGVALSFVALVGSVIYFLLTH